MKYAGFEKRYKAAENSFNAITEQIKSQQARHRQLMQMAKELKKEDGVLTEFDAGLWGLFVEKMTVVADGSMVVKFKDGTEEKVMGRI